MSAAHVAAKSAMREGVEGRGHPRDSRALPAARAPQRASHRALEQSRARLQL